MRIRIGGRLPHLLHGRYDAIATPRSYGTRNLTPYEGMSWSRRSVSLLDRPVIPVLLGDPGAVVDLSEGPGAGTPRVSVSRVFNPDNRGQLPAIGPERSPSSREESVRQAIPT